MNQLRKNQPRWRDLALFLAVLPLWSGCAPVLVPQSGEGSRSLTIQSGSLGARLVMPTLGTLTYDLSMTGPGGENFQDLGDADGLFTLRNLALGSWTAAISVRSDGSVVASGTATRTVTAGASPTLVVPMAWVFTGDTTSPVFSVDASASPYPVLAASVFWDGVKTGDTLDLATKTLTLNFGEQNQGVHQLRIVFYKDLQKTLPVGLLDQGIVYLGVAGVPDLVLSADDFFAPGRPEMVAIPGGTFTMGNATATLSRFLMGRFPVTQAQFEAVMGFNPSDYDNSNTTSRANPEAPWAPVESVTWFDAAEYTNRLSLLEGLRPVYTLTTVVRSGDHIISATVSADLSQNGYRLPTEAEYEYATRAGTTGDYFWGGADGALYSWGTYDTGSPLARTYGVGQKLPNAWGLHDMIGNVWSWTNDYWDTQPAVATFDYAGPATGSYRLLKGGSFLSSSATSPTLDVAFRSSFRGFYDAPASTMSDVGFRIVRREQTAIVSSPDPAVLSGTVPATTLHEGMGRFTHVQPDLQHPGKFLASGVSGRLNNTGISPWGTNLMARFTSTAALDPTFGNNTDGPLDAARQPWGHIDLFSLFAQTNVIQSQYGFNGVTGESYFSGFVQNAFGLYLFQPSVAGGWNHTEVYRHDFQGVLDVGYSQPVYTPGTEDYLPFVVYAQFRALTPSLARDDGTMYSAGADTETGNFVVVKMAADGAYPWQNDPANKERYFSGPATTTFSPVKMTLQPDQKLLVVGNDPNGVNGTLLRIDVSGAAGVLDSGFGSGGSVTLGRGAPDGSQRHYSDVEHRDGKIYVLGWDSYGPDTSAQGFVIRLNSDGTLDPAFAPPGNNGALAAPFHQPSAMALTADKIVVVGTSVGSPTRPFVQRFGLGGLAAGGPVLLSDGGYGGGALDVAADAAGVVGVVGYAYKAGHTEEYQTLPRFWKN